MGSRNRNELLIHCPGCSAERLLQEVDCTCEICGTEIIAPFGVPILVSGAVVETSEIPSDELIESLTAALNAREKADELRRCFSMRIKMPDPSMQVEAQQFLNRLISGGTKIVAEKRTAGVAIEVDAINVIDHISVNLDPLIMPPVFEAGERTSISVKITNVGESILSSKVAAPFLLSYLWRPKKRFLFNSSDKRQCIEGHRTQLLIDLAPGRSITQGLFIDVPIDPGKWELVIAALVEGVTWFPHSGKLIPTFVKNSPLFQAYVHKTDGPPLSYNEQHIRGSRLLVDWVAKHIKEIYPLVLEIGGNFHPSTEGYNIGDVINLDVDAHGLMTRNIVKNDGIISVVGDGMNPPFPDNYFDVITMFSSFHHFGDPIGLLRRLSRKINKNGIICLMCEPIGHVRPEHNYYQYINELEQGINEQSFEIWEYIAMAEASKLEVVDALFDRGSAMLALRPTV